MTLLPDEKIVFEGDAKYRGTDGILKVTNKRILFHYKEGIIFRGVHKALEMTLDKIADVSISGSFLWKKLIVTTSERDRIPRHEFQVQEEKLVLDKILDAVCKAKSKMF
jgi:hypothetical protein